MVSADYDPQEIESRWQSTWDAQGVYRAGDQGGTPYYLLEMFPYPSGRGRSGRGTSPAGSRACRPGHRLGKHPGHPKWTAIGIRFPEDRSQRSP